jgi:hypothetical protein
MVMSLRKASANGWVATVPMIEEIATTLTVRGDYPIAVGRRTHCESSLPQAILSLPAGLAFCILLLLPQRVLLFATNLSFF